ncbi:tudor domain-containing protein 1 [Elysia marginata]|uniref:Tudor domain-containing protein 1 n=1 Tax=Elysia marginata TaxID=1093978 RepID=A0AAV4F4V3_9GAST|nr:tudor domain-containing protein 1 [Elysia marginata]
MDALAERYYDLGPSDRTLNNKRLGGLCAAKFTDDNNWYRARITGLIKTGMIEVQFVDYGNTDYVSDDRVKSLDPDLVHYPIQCYRCALANVSSTQGYWTPESTIKFEDKTMDQRCEAYFSGKTQDDTYLVHMIDADGNSLNEMFGAVGSSRRPQASAVEETGFKDIAWKNGAKVQATVAYVQSPDLFWCQDQSFANELLILSEELSRFHMTQGIQPMSDIRPGSVCAAKFSEDEAWYRGVVQAVSNGTAQVYFVDYGNTESVPLDLICRLSPGMKTMPALAAKCCLSGVSSGSGTWDQSAVDQFEELVVDKEFEMKIVDRKGDIYIVSLVDIVENTDVSSQMRSFLSQRGGAPRSTGDINSNSSQGKEIAGVGPSLSVGSQVETFLTWVDNPGDFWVQLKDFEYLVEKLSDELQEFYAQPRPSTSVSPGAFIVAKYSEDQMWYRGLVLKEVSSSEVLVLFIDFGNSDIVSKTNLRQVSPAFGEVVPLAFRCALVGIKPLNEDTKVWTTDAKTFLEEMTQNGCVCEVVSETESRKLVRLSVNGKDVASELASLRVVAETSANKGSTCPRYTKQITVGESEVNTVTVTHVSSPQDFWCQLNINFAPLDNLMEKLDAHYSDDGGTPIRDKEIGRACIAQYSEDNAWYRGKIVDTSHGGLTVQFVDYGNSEIVSANLVCEPEPRFLDLPVQAVHCSLPLQGNLSHLADTMNDLVLEKELRMEVVGVSNDCAVVELYDADTKISDLLKQYSQTRAPGHKQQQLVGLKPATPISAETTVKAFTSFVDSPSKFYVQLADKEEELGSLMDDISVYNAQNSGQQSLSTPQVNQACMALFSEDNQWYRGIIKSLQGSNCNVLFVDYGNEESMNKDTLKALPSEFAMIPAFAYECSLEGTDGATWSEEAKHFFESIIMDQELQCTFVSKTSVKILIGGEDVKNELISNGFFQAQKASPKPFGASSLKPQINGGSGDNRRKDDNGWTGSEQADQVTSGFGSSSQSFGSRERNKPSGFGSNRSESGSGFGSSRDENKSSFGSRGSGSSGFGGGPGQRERKASSGSSAAGGEFTYAEPPSEPESALLVHMDEDGTFYLQLPSMEKDILFLAKRLAGSYKNGGGPRLKDTAAKGVVCCAKFPEDGCMYRCLILDVKGGTAVLRYVDYGNIAECSTRDLKMLFPDLLPYAVQAYPCKLKGLTWSIDQAEKFASATLDQDLKVTFSGASPPYEVEVETPNGDLLDILTGKIAFTPSPPSQSDTGTKQKGFGGGFSSPKKNDGGGFGTSKGSPKVSEHSQNTGRSLPPPAPKICEQKYITQNAPAGEVESYICHVDEDGYFYLQLDKDTATLDSVMGQLEGLTGQHPNPSTGAACAAVFSEDSAWYRALITCVEGDSLKVTFIDYGNGDKVQKNSVKPLTSALLINEPLSFKCQFSDLGPLSEQAQKKLSGYLIEHKVTATFTSKVSPYSVTMLDAEGNDLQETICPSDCYRAQARPKNVIPAGVTHIEDDGRFYIQLYADFSAIAKLHKSLSETYSSSSLEKIVSPEVGMACAFEMDEGEWCRGQIQKITDESIEVIDVDTGKTTTKDAESLFSLPLHFFKSPPYGYECRLKGVESWTDDLRKRFIEMTEEKILNATFYTSSAPFRVSLARSIELDLLGLSAPMPDSPVKEEPTKNFPKSSAETSGQDAYISQVDADGTFYVQTVAREDDLNAMSEKLEAAIETVTTGDLSVAPVGAVCCAKFTEDDAWYRALVTACDEDKGQVSVRFVDYGNTDMVEADRVAVLPEEFELSKLPAFATKSRLSGISDLTDEAVQKLKDAVLDQVVTVETKTRVEDCDEVVVKVAGTALTDVLGLQVAKTETSGTDAYISHVDADGTFYVQTVAREDDLNAMSEKLEAALETVTTGDLSVAPVGAVCCAKFTEDDAWYRALVTACDGDKGQVSVRFVDYGNTDMVEADRVAVLPEEFELSKLPAFATKSRLSGVSDLTDETVQKLKDAVLDQVVTVQSKTKVEDCDEVVVKVAGTALTDVLGLQVAKAETSGQNAYISQVDADGTFYVQTVAREDDLNAMSEKLEVALESVTTGDLSVAPVGAVCCAKFTEDDAWYRALVTACDGDKGQMSVRFVDYGNTDMVEADRVAVLPEEFELSKLPAFATKSRLSGVSDLTDEAVQKLKDAVLDQVVTVETKTRVEDCDEVVVKVAGTALTDVLGLQVAKAESASADTSNSQEVEEFVDASEMVETVKAEADEFTDAVEPVEETAGELKNQEGLESTSLDKLPTGSRVSITVSFVVSPSEFYFQLDQKQGEYNTLMDQMFEHFSGLPEGEGAIQEKLSVGKMCAALYAEDESWYRALVKDVTDGSYTIFFMDHGNTEVAEADTLRVLDDQFRSLPPAVKKASLAGVRPVSDEWSNEAISEFKEQVEEKSLLADLISTTDDQTTLRLLELGIPVHEELIKKGYGIASDEDIVINQAVQHIFSDSNDTFMESKSEGLSAPLDESESERNDSDKVCGITRPAQSKKIGSVANTLKELEDVPVYVSHVTSPSLFWCQLANCVEILKEISDILGAEFNDPEQRKLTQDAGTGDFVIARSSCDGLLYRSKVLSQQDDKKVENNESKVCLQFIDFGTEGQVEKDHLFKMEGSLLKFPAQAFRCSLENIKPEQGDSWPQNACEKFTKVVKDRELSLRLVGRDQDGTSLVELTDPQTSQPLSSLLLETGFATDSVEKGTKKCSDSLLPADTSTFDNLEITHPIMESTAAVQDTTQAMQSFSIEDGKDGHFRVYSLSLHTEYDILFSNVEVPNTFHVRLLEMDKQFASLVAEIQQYITSEADADSLEQFVPNVNDPCLVRWNETWHRATVLDREELKWNVKLQDYGRELRVDPTELRKMPLHFLELPAQAIKCYLAGIVSVEPEWCSDAIDFFKDRAGDGKFCMYVVEDAHKLDKGKYGVVISDLESSESSSVNRAMVDLDYATVVPGSYIDIQLDMEKTLDTNMLNELEESFNEVSLLKCNADDVGETDDAAFVMESGEAHSYCDSYKESDISKSCKKKVDPHLYQLVQITDNSREGSEAGDSELQVLKTSGQNYENKNNSFCLALDVERIEQNGCLDIETSDAVVPYEGFDGEISTENTQALIKEMCKLDDKSNEQAKVESKEKETLAINQNELHLDSSLKDKTSSPGTHEMKPLYTWKLDGKALPVQKSVEVQKQSSNDVQEDSHIKGIRTGYIDEKTGEEKKLEVCDIHPQKNEPKDSYEDSKNEKKAQGHFPEAKSNDKVIEITLEQHRTAEEISKEEETSSSKFDHSRSSLATVSEVEMEWDDLISSKDNSKAAKGMSEENKDKQKLGEREEGVSAPSSSEKSGSNSEHTPSISPESGDVNIMLEQDSDPKNSSISESKSLKECRMRYRSSTPSKTVKTTKAQRRVKCRNLAYSKTSDDAFLAHATTTSINTAYATEEGLQPPKLTDQTEAGMFLIDIKGENAPKEESVEVQPSSGSSKIEELPYDAESLETVAKAQSLTKESQYEDVKYLKSSENVEIAEVEEEASIESGRSSSTEASFKEQSGNEVTQFMSCPESDDSNVSIGDNKVSGACHPSSKDKSIAESNTYGHRAKEKQSEERLLCYEASPEKSSFDTTADEYESCSETGPDDSESHGFLNSLEAIQGSIALENLSSFSLSETNGKETSCDTTSLLLSGSSFDTSAATSDTVSTLGKDDYSEDFTSSQLDDDSYLEGLLNQPKATTESSSSLTSSETNSQESSCTTGNDSVSTPLKTTKECEFKDDPYHKISGQETGKEDSLQTDASSEVVVAKLLKTESAFCPNEAADNTGAESVSNEGVTGTETIYVPSEDVAWKQKISQKEVSLCDIETVYKDSDPNTNRAISIDNMCSANIESTAQDVAIEVETLKEIEKQDNFSRGLVVEGLRIGDVSFNDVPAQEDIVGSELCKDKLDEEMQEDHPCDDVESESSHRESTTIKGKQENLGSQSDLKETEELPSVEHDPQITKNELKQCDEKGGVNIECHESNMKEMMGELTEKHAVDDKNINDADGTTNSEQCTGENFREILSPGAKREDEGNDDDAYYDDSQTKSGTELCGDEQVLAGAPALDAEHDTADDDTLGATRNELDSQEKQIEKSVDLTPKNVAEDSGDEAEESQC